MAAISRVIIGASTSISAAFVDASGNPADPTGTPEVTLTLVDPAGNVTTGAYSPNSGIVITRASAGVFTATISPAVVGLWRWAFTGTVAGVAQLFRGSFTVNGATDYPCEYGYADISDVQARVASAQWNPLDPAQAADAYPTVAQVNDWITQASHSVDAVLLRRGYNVPLVPQPSTTIAPQAWTILQTVSAEIVTGWVENTRGSQDDKGMATGEWHLKYADDLLARLENGDDNLTLLGVAGTFEPQADPAGAMNTNMDDPDPITNQVPSPVFRVVPMQSVGYQQGAPLGDPLSQW